MKHASATSAQSNHLRWWPALQSHASTYTRVVQGSKKNPSSGMIQLLKARLRTSPKIHKRNSASRGEMSAKSEIRQQPVVGR